MVKTDEKMTVDSGPDLLGRIAHLHRQIAERVEQPAPIDPAVQELLGRLSLKLPYLTRLKNTEVNVEQAELAVNALLSKSPEVNLAEIICSDLERRVDIYKNPIRSIINGRTPATFVLCGLLVHVGVLAVAVYIVSQFIPCSGVAGTVCWIPMVIAGAAGGATSLFTRLGEIAALSRWSAEGDPLQLFYTGLLKPLVGIAMGLLAFATISTGLVTIRVPVDGASPAVLYTALAFLGGFSERFARDVMEPLARPTMGD